MGRDEATTGAFNHGDECQRDFWDVRVAVNLLRLCLKHWGAPSAAAGDDIGPMAHERAITRQNVRAFLTAYDQRPRTSTGGESDTASRVIEPESQKLLDPSLGHSRGRDGATGMPTFPFCPKCKGYLTLFTEDVSYRGPQRFWCDNMKCDALPSPVPVEPPPSPRVTPAETGPNQDFIDGRNAALANAAMLAYDMGHPDVRHAINQLFPENSPERPIDTPPGNPRFSRSAIDSPAPRVTTPEAEKSVHCRRESGVCRGLSFCRCPCGPCQEANRNEAGTPRCRDWCGEKVDPGVYAFWPRVIQDRRFCTDACRDAGRPLHPGTPSTPGGPL